MPSFATCLLTILSVTNHAGHVVSGELTSVTNGQFTISGRTYPMSILPAAEQQRVKAAAGLDVRTPKEKRIQTDRDYQLKRIDARLAEGEITAEEAEKLRTQQRAAAEFRQKRSLRPTPP